MPPAPEFVAAVNRLCSRWAAALPDTATVASGVCAWPLLALLAGAASGHARVELRAATGVEPEAATGGAREVLAALSGAPGIAAALGLWTRDDLPIRPQWLAGLPDGVHGGLSGDPATDQPRLDAWAARRTGDQVRRMPVRVDPDTALLLASALAVETAWVRPFEDRRLRWAGEGAYRGAAVHGVNRTGADLTEVYVAGGVSGVRVTGDNGIDVHVLLGGAGVPASRVLVTGVGAATGVTGVTDAAHLAEGTPGPGLRIATAERVSPRDSCTVTLPRFTVRGGHDLLALPEVFGLATVTDKSRGHLPAISERPLAVAQARQDAFATFSAVGFRAAAVTAVSVMVGAAMRQATHQVRVVSFTVDRPCGFVAVHRPTGLVLATGWVTEPDPDAGAPPTSGGV